MVSWPHPCEPTLTVIALVQCSYNSCAWLRGYAYIILFSLSLSLFFTILAIYHLEKLTTICSEGSLLGWSRSPFSLGLYWDHAIPVPAKHNLLLRSKS